MQRLWAIMGRRIIFASTGSRRTGWAHGETGARFILGTEGYIELRKYVDIASDRRAAIMCIWLTRKASIISTSRARSAYPFFGELILDCLNRTENAMTQEHAFKAAELCLMAQRDAVWLEGASRGI